MGRRVQKVVYGYSSGAWVQQKEILFVYDGWNLVKETTTHDGGSSVDKYYVWGLDLSRSMQGAGGVGGLLAAIDGSLTYQYLYDANGNVGQVVNTGDGTIAAHYEYDPYGNLVNQSGAYADENAYRFSTKYFDSEANLYYYGYRYYSGELGRWINRDPIGENAGLNIHTFLLNAPLNFIDPLGLIEILVPTPVGPVPMPIPYVPPVVNPQPKDPASDYPFGGSDISDWVDPYTDAKPDERNKDKKRDPLFHYTNLDGYSGILAKQEINPSIGIKNARYGDGQYFTDIPPEVIIFRKKGELTEKELYEGYKSVWQVSYSLYGMPWNTNKLKYYGSTGINVVDFTKCALIY